jgi:hypothetical protein
VHPADLAAEAIAATLGRKDGGSGPGRRCGLWRRGCHRRAGRQHCAHWVARGRIPARCPRCHRRSAVRIELVGDSLCGASGHERHRRVNGRRWGCEHETYTDRVGDGRRCAVRLRHPFADSTGWRRRYGTQEVSQFRGAELIAAEWGISRAEMERWALRSHQRAATAIKGGGFEREIVLATSRSTNVPARRAWRRWLRSQP